MDFFNNSQVDKFLSKGKYQFFIRSDSYRETFSKTKDLDETNVLEPPALSMVILQIHPDGLKYKIVLDDAFYVPFGVGYWTSEMEVQEGEYRFIFPKMAKDFSLGSFGIVGC